LNLLNMNDCVALDKISMRGEILTSRIQMKGSVAIQDIADKSEVYIHFLTAIEGYSDSKGLVRYLKNKGFHVEKYSLSKLMSMWNERKEFVTNKVKQPITDIVVDVFNTVIEGYDESVGVIEYIKDKGFPVDDYTVSGIMRMWDDKKKEERLEIGRKLIEEKIVIPFANIVDNIKRFGYSRSGLGVIVYNEDKKLSYSQDANEIKLSRIPMFLTEINIREIGCYAEKKKTVVDDYIKNTKLVGGEAELMTVVEFENWHVKKGRINIMYDKVKFKKNIKFDSDMKQLITESWEECVIAYPRSSIILVPRKIYVGKFDVLCKIYSAEGRFTSQIFMHHCGELKEPHSEVDSMTMYRLNLQHDMENMCACVISVMIKGVARSEVPVSIGYKGLDTCVEFDNAIIVHKTSNINIRSMEETCSFEWEKNVFTYLCCHYSDLTTVNETNGDQVKRLIVVKGHYYLNEFCRDRVRDYINLINGCESNAYCSVLSCDRKQYLDRKEFKEYQREKAIITKKMESIKIEDLDDSCSEYED